MDFSARKSLLRWGLLITSLVIGVMLSEVVLRHFRPLSDVIPAQPSEDEFLRHRILPYQSGHDKNGFRNDTAEGYFPIICIGDSQVYGTSVSRKYAFPQQLSRILNLPVYNMGLGGYGPIQYYYLLKEARKTKPKIIIIAIAMNNDMLETYDLAAELPKWNWMLDEIKGDNWLDDCPSCSLTYKRSHNIKYNPDIITSELKESGSLTYRVHLFFRLHSVLYASLYEDLLKPIIRSLMEKQKHLDMPGAYHVDFLDTVFLPGYYIGSVDLRDERIRTGAKLTKKIIEMMGAEEKDKKKLLFVLIPTKEAVYYNFLKQRGARLPAEFECQVYYERVIAKQLQNIITAQGFQFLDVLPTLEAAANRGILLYPASSDCHPNKRGLRLIANALSNAINPDSLALGFPNQRQCQAK